MRHGNPLKLPLLFEACLRSLIFFVCVVVLHEVLQLLYVLFEAYFIECLVDISFNYLLLLVLLADVIGDRIQVECEVAGELLERLLDIS